MGRFPFAARLLQFLDELRKRSVYHTGAAYIAGAFIVWQVADIVFPALGLPPSAMSFLVFAAAAGLPIALMLSWLFEIIPDRQRRPISEPADPARAPTGRRGLRGAVPIMLVSAAFVTCAGITWSIVPHGQVLEGEGGLELLIADAENDTGDPLFDGTLNEGLRIGLVQSPHLVIVTRSRISAVLSEMRRPDDAPLDAATATEAAIRGEVDLVVLPAIRRVGKRFRITTSLIDPATGIIIVARSAHASDIDGVLPALDELARQLRSDLGEPLRSMVQQNVRLDHATTASLEALKLWNEGNKLWALGRGADSRSLYEQALALDSTFAMAYSDLAQFHYWFANDARAGAQYMAAALRHSARVPPRERLKIEAKAAQWEGNHEQAATLYRALVTQYPRDVAAWSSLGYQSLRLGRDREAIEAYEHVIALDSLNAAAWLNLATVHSRTDHALAADLYDRAFALAPDHRTVANINHEWGFNLMQAGRWDEAEAAFRLLLDGNAGLQAQAHRSLAQLRIARGRLLEGVDHLRTAVLLSRAAGAKGTELRNRMLLIEALALIGVSADSVDWGELQALALEGQLSSWYPATLGVWAVRSGRVSEALDLLDTARARSRGGLMDRASVRRLEAEIAAADGKPAVAVELLLEALAITPHDKASRFALAEILLELGDTADAEDHYREATVSPLDGNEYLVPTLMAQHRLASLLDVTGRPADAAVRYCQLLELWADGNDAVTLSDHARSRATATAVTSGANVCHMPRG